jgi:hypothetical protein
VSECGTDADGERAGEQGGQAVKTTGLQMESAITIGSQANAESLSDKNRTLNPKL